MCVCVCVYVCVYIYIYVYIPCYMADSICRIRFSVIDSSSPQNFNVWVTLPSSIHMDVTLHFEYNAMISSWNIQSILMTRFLEIFLITLFFICTIFQLFKMNTARVFPNWKNIVLGFPYSGTSLHLCDYIITVPATFCWSLDMDGTGRNCYSSIFLMERFSVIGRFTPSCSV